MKIFTKMPVGPILGKIPGLKNLITSYLPYTEKPDHLSLFRDLHEPNPKACPVRIYQEEMKQIQEELHGHLKQYVLEAPNRMSFRDFLLKTRGADKANSILLDLKSATPDLLLHYMQRLFLAGYFGPYAKSFDPDRKTQALLNAIITIIGGRKFNLSKGLDSYLDGKQIPQGRYDTVANVMDGILNHPCNYRDENFISDPYIESYAHVHNALAKSPLTTSLIAVDYIQKPDFNDEVHSFSQKIWKLGNLISLLNHPPK